MAAAKERHLLWDKIADGATASVLMGVKKTFGRCPLIDLIRDTLLSCWTNFIITNGAVQTGPNWKLETVPAMLLRHVCWGITEV